MGKYTCEICVNRRKTCTFSSSSNFKRHNRRFHNGLQTHTTFKYKCKESGCSFRAQHVDQLVAHLCATHQMGQYAVESAMFENKNDFDAWREEKERKTSSQLVKPWGTKSSKQRITTTYWCFRSSRSDPRLQAPDSADGCNQIHCTAFMKVIETGVGLNVSYCFQHYGHDPAKDIITQRLPVSFREEMAELMRTGVPPGRALLNLRTAAFRRYAEDRIETREMFAGIQDAYNIQRDYGLVFSLNGADEFDRLASDFRDQQLLPPDERCLLLLKLPGVTHPDYLGLPEAHFVAVIQTPFQRDMLKKYGGKGVCVDSTHNCFAEDKIKLTTLLVLDESERGVPVAHCFLSSEDTASCAAFFRVLSDQVYTLGVTWFLSDDADAFFNGWSHTFPDAPASKILCTWHVLKNVYEGVNRHCKDLEAAALIKGAFRDVMYAESTLKCDELLADLRMKLLSYPAAAKYLEGTYFGFRNGLCRVNQWALSYRVGARMSTSGFVESFHRKFKKDFLHSVGANCVDELFRKLLVYLDEIQMSRIVALAKCTPSFRMSEISKSHPVRSDGESYLFWRHSTHTWTCVKLRDEFSTYFMKLKDCTFQNCAMVCGSCKVICVHQVACSCPSALGGFRYCKHAHYFCENLSKPENATVLLEFQSKKLPFVEHARLEVVWSQDTVQSTNFASEDVAVARAMPTATPSTELLQTLDESRYTEQLASLKRLVLEMETNRTPESARRLTAILKTATNQLAQFANSSRRPRNSRLRVQRRRYKITKRKRGKNEISQVS